jgi:hypothetical protein
MKPLWKENEGGLRNERNKRNSQRKMEKIRKSNQG